MLTDGTSGGMPGSMRPHSEGPQSTPNGSNGAAACGGAKVPIGTGFEAGSASILDTKRVARDVLATPADPLAARIDRLGMLKRESQKIAEWGREEGDSETRQRAGKQMGCGGYLVFRQAVATGTARLHKAYFCQQGSCPFCATRRAVKCVQAYGPKVFESWMDECWEPGAGIQFVTLTRRNVECGLAEALERFEEAYRLLMQFFRDRNKRKGNAMAAIAGGVNHLEIKRGKRAGLWHVHAHGAWVCKKRPDYGAMVDLWAKCCGEVNGIRFKKLKAQAAYDRGDFDGDESGDELVKAMSRDLVEVIKYPMKFGELPPVDVWEVANVIRGRKLLRPFGCMVGVEVDPSLLDQPMDWDSIEWVARQFVYARGAGYKERVSHRWGIADNE